MCNTYYSKRWLKSIPLSFHLFIDFRTHGVPSGRTESYYTKLNFSRLCSISQMVSYIDDVRGSAVR